MSKKLLFAIMAIVLCVGLVGGAFSYFTDTVTSNSNTLQAGTLDIQIANPGGTYGNGPVTASFVSPSGWAPGQFFVNNIFAF